MTYGESAAEILPGLYRHYKGNYYRVLFIARHSETTEPMVVYKALYGNGDVWVRPAGMWYEMVEQNGKMVQRFHRLNTAERVAFYEQIYDELSIAVHEAGALAEKPQMNAAVDEAGALAEELQLKAVLLEEYYTSGEWREDYEADENGLLPADLKRGVLSQDGVYDLLEECQEMGMNIDR